MFVIFISFIFVLILSVGRTTEIKHVPLKEKLEKSLAHIKDMLVEIDAKIEHERTLLSQISDNLNTTDGPAVARMNYDEVTDIWWKSSNPVITPTQPTFLPNQPTTGSALPPKHDQHLHTTTESLFIRDLKETMAADRHSYFTAFLTRFVELIVVKNPEETMPVIHLLSKLAIDTLNDGRYNEPLGKRLVSSLKFVIPIVDELTPVELKQKALLAFYKLKNKETMLLADQSYVIKFYAKLFTTEEIERLFQALEAFAYYPKGQKSASQVTYMIFNAVLEPFIRIQDQPSSVQPERRSMNLEQRNKHILLKHPKLLGTLMQGFKHFKNSFKSYKKPNKKYRKNRDEHLNEPEQTRRRAYVPSEEDHNHSEYFQNSTENDKLHKIREASSYSDETDQLRNNVHDALRHGNRTFEAFRKSGGDVNNKQTDRALSTETDNEWVIKNNIYKAFEAEEGRFP